MSNFKIEFKPDRSLKLYGYNPYKYGTEQFSYISPPRSLILRECEWWRDPSEWLVYPQEVKVKTFNTQLYYDLQQWYAANMMIGCMDKYYNECTAPFIYNCNIPIIKSANIACIYNSSIGDIMDTEIICIAKSKVQKLEGNSKVHTITGKSHFMSFNGIAMIKDTVRICNVIDCDIGTISDFAQIHLVKNINIHEMKYNSQIWIADNTVIDVMKHNASVEALLNQSRINFQIR